ncbi:SpaN/EivJ family type III secretion system needle length determinant [Providencia manganoxydans]|uniref:SpaN/EivJ family type III secretion system needle length determinant n=1 Tax=Providencia manganoxydans TaxID=2923283 RepID=UPI0034E52A93
MATMKLEFNEPLHQLTEDLFIPPTAGKNADSQTLIKKRIADAASKKAYPSEPKKHRRKWAEETLAPLISQLPMKMQPPEMVEKLMAFCQLGLEVKSASSLDGLSLEGELTTIDDLPLAPLSVSATIIGSQLGNKSAAVTKDQITNTTIETNKIISNYDETTEAITPKLVTELASSMINQRDMPHQSSSVSNAMLSDIIDIPIKPLSTSDKLLPTSDKPSTSVFDISHSNIKVTHDDSAMLFNKQPKALMTGKPSQAELFNTNILKNNQLSTNLDAMNSKSAMQPVKQFDELTISQPIQHQQLDNQNESPDVLAMQNNHGAQTSTNTAAMAGTLSQPRQETNSVSKIAEVIAKTASVTSDSVAKVEGRSLTYTFNQWQNSPSVTFELAARGSELLATTTSPEVHRALHENQHLFRSEQPLSIRHEEQRHERQRQQQQEQPEQEDN